MQTTGVEVSVVIVTHSPYAIREVKDATSKEMKSLILYLMEDDILDIKGIGLIRISSFKVDRKYEKSAEKRMLMIYTEPV